nr:MAG TPA: hypothetical protein [Caudoviricetes sp.]
MIPLYIISLLCYFVCNRISVCFKVFCIFI